MEPGAGFTGGPGVQVQPGQPNPYVDRVTGEDVQNDHEFKILLAVVLDPAAPEAPPPAQPAEGETPAEPAEGATPAEGEAPAPAAAETPAP
jgi:hypothetical protein